MWSPYSYLYYEPGCKFSGSIGRVLLSSDMNRTALTSKTLRQNFGELFQKHSDLKDTLRAMQDAPNSFRTSQDQMARSQEATQDKLIDVKHKAEAIW